jgi:hypothetical protein
MVVTICFGEKYGCVLWKEFLRTLQHTRIFALTCYFIRAIAAEDCLSWIARYVKGMRQVIGQTRWTTSVYTWLPVGGASSDIPKGGLDYVPSYDNARVSACSFADEIFGYFEAWGGFSARLIVVLRCHSWPKSVDQASSDVSTHEGDYSPGYVTCIVQSRPKIAVWHHEM